MRNKISNKNLFQSVLLGDFLRKLENKCFGRPLGMGSNISVDLIES